MWDRWVINKERGKGKRENFFSSVQLSQTFNFQIKLYTQFLILKGERDQPPPSPQKEFSVSANFCTSVVRELTRLE